MTMAGLGRRRVKAALLLLIGAFALNACVGQSCSEVGCENQLLVHVTHEGAWTDGAYELDLARDGVTTSCSFTLPDNLPKPGMSATLDCGSDASVQLERVTICTSTTSKDGNSGSGVCNPVPDRYQLSLDLLGNPRRVSFTLMRDGEVLLNDSRDPHYSRTYPNGSDCDEGCSQGGYDLSF